jgi:hypothetical protein
MSLERADIAIRLVEERGRVGYSQADFSAKLGVSREGLRLYETGQRGVAGEFLAQAATLGVDVQYVLTGVRSANAAAVEKAVDGIMTMTVTGGTNVNVGTVQSGARVTQINTQRHIEKTVANVKPGEAHITDEQAAMLHALVDEIVKTEVRLKKNPRSHRSVWGALNAHCKAPAYRLIKTEDFQKAQKYLHQWMGRLGSMASAPVKNGDAWRKRKYAYIKINCKNDTAALERYVARNFQTTSLTELDNQQLEQTYRYVAGRKNKNGG